MDEDPFEALRASVRAMESAVNAVGAPPAAAPAAALHQPPPPQPQHLKRRRASDSEERADDSSKEEIAPPAPALAADDTELSESEDTVEGIRVTARRTRFEGATAAVQDFLTEFRQQQHYNQLSNYRIDYPDDRGGICLIKGSVPDDRGGIWLIKGGVRFRVAQIKQPVPTGRKFRNKIYKAWSASSANPRNKN